MTASGVFLTNSSAFAAAPSMPPSLEVFIISPPKAFMSICFSGENLSGTTKIVLYPFSSAANASPSPVFPAVGATITLRPGIISPFSSASRSMYIPVRSFTLPDGFHNSSFAKSLTPSGRARSLVSSTRGVLPTRSCIDL